MRLKLTDSAAEQVHTLLAKRGSGIGIKVGVKEVGCSGLQYTLEYVDDVLPLSHLDDTYLLGFNVYIAPEDCQYFENATLDYAKEGLNEGFKFINEAEKTKCGCGKSFKV